MTTLQIEEGKFYKRADGSVHGPATLRYPRSRQPMVATFPWDVGTSGSYTAYGSFYSDQEHDFDLVAEVIDPSGPVSDQHAVDTVEGKADVEDDGFVTHKPAWAQAVEAEAAEEIDSLDKIQAEMEAEIKAEIASEQPTPAASIPELMQELNEAETSDIKTTLADEAKRIVSGARRNAYGTPEANFERIARFWQAYFENTGRGAVAITAADVSPLMRMVKEARLCESPTHYDSFVDLLGYAMTGAEVNAVTKPTVA